MYRDATRRLPEDSDVLRIASEGGDILLYPLQCGDLVHVSVVTFELFRMLAAQCGEGEESKSPQTVIQRDEDHALPSEWATPRARKGAAAKHESPTMNPDHDRKS